MIGNFFYNTPNTHIRVLCVKFSYDPILVCGKMKKFHFYFILVLRLWKFSKEQGKFSSSLLRLFGHVCSIGKKKNYFSSSLMHSAMPTKTKKKSVFFFKKGKVFSFRDNSPIGESVSLIPQRKIFLLLNNYGIQHYHIVWLFSQSRMPYVDTLEVVPTRGVLSLI